MKNIFLILILNSIFTFAQTDYNKLDENGKKHGVWKGFHDESKRLRYQGTFEHGKEVGIFNYYDDTKDASIIGVREFSAKDNSAYTTFYDQKKNIVSEGKAINKLNEGVWKYYHEASKEVMTLENYKNGKLEGLRSVFYPSAILAEETNYKNGQKEGVYKKYTEKGIVLETVTYKNGEYDGLATYKDPNDKIVAEGLFKNGKKVGIWKFYENGKLTSKENFNFQGKKFQKKKPKA
jgi:antitoxin component YwqK of YwqJK toxin-antitoxin module